MNPPLRETPGGTPVVPRPAPTTLPPDLLTGSAPRAARLLALSLLEPVAGQLPDLRPLLDRLSDGAAQLDGDPAALTAALGSVAALLAAHARAGTETERKYLLRTLPDVAREAPWRDIVQGYLPGTEIVERLRVVTTPDGRVRRYRTIKLGTGLTRLEAEEEAGAELLDALWPLTVGRRVAKRRYLVEDGPHRWEVDVFQGRDLVLAELELRDATEGVELPTWLAPQVVREVTGEDAYVNLNLAR